MNCILLILAVYSHESCIQRPAIVDEDVCVAGLEDVSYRIATCKTRGVNCSETEIGESSWVYNNKYIQSICTLHFWMQARPGNTNFRIRELTVGDTIGKWVLASGLGVPHSN